MFTVWHTWRKVETHLKQWHKENSQPHCPATAAEYEIARETSPTSRIVWKGEKGRKFPEIEPSCFEYR